MTLSTTCLCRSSTIKHCINDPNKMTQPNFKKLATVSDNIKSILAEVNCPKGPLHATREAAVILKESSRNGNQCP